MNLNPLDKKLQAFGFNVLSINGHNYSELRHNLRIDRFNLPEKPLAIIANTIKGKGVPLIEDKREWHSKKPNDDEFTTIINQLGMNREEFEKL
jgi:transketolase